MAYAVSEYFPASMLRKREIGTSKTRFYEIARMLGDKNAKLE